jgi:hypothetical protein
VPEKAPAANDLSQQLEVDQFDIIHIASPVHCGASQSMPEPASDTLIRRWGDRLSKSALARAAVVGLRARADEIWRRAFELLQRESPEYRNAVDDEFADESKAHCHELLMLIVAVAAGEARKSARDPFDFVRTHAQWRARHHVPLVASLHAYRIAHRTYSEISQDENCRL